MKKSEKGKVMFGKQPPLFEVEVVVNVFLLKSSAIRRKRKRDLKSSQSVIKSKNCINIY